MQLNWLLLISAATFLLDTVSSAANILTEINQKTKSTRDVFDLKEPFKPRTRSQATFWNIRKESSFRFHLEKKEDCQEVWLCHAVRKKADSWCKKYTRFRPMEGTVTIGIDKDGPKTTGETFVYPWTDVTVVYDSKTKKYRLKVSTKDRNILGEVDPQSVVEKDIPVSEVPLIITSSPYCFPIVQDTSGYPVSSDALGQVELAFPQMRLVDAIHDKKTSLLVPTHITKYTTSKSVQCPPVWKPEFELTEDIWDTWSKAVKQRAAFMTYTIKRRTRPDGTDCTEGSQGRFSIKLKIDKPEVCTWIRLCFGDGQSELCADPKKSVELLMAYRLFVGVDSDEAQSMEADWQMLELIRFQWSNIGGNTRFTMSYGFASDEGAVQHHMFGDDVKEMLTSSTVRVTLARDSECMARLITDYELESPEKKGAQCLRVNDCAVVIPQEFAEFPGSEAVSLEDYAQDS